MLHVGYGNYISQDKILGITTSETAPFRRMRQKAQNIGKLIDCTNGVMTKSMLHLEDGYIAISARESEALINRLRALRIGE